MPASERCFFRENLFSDELPNYLVLGNMSLRIFTLGIEGHFCCRKQNLAISIVIAKLSNCVEHKVLVHSSGGRNGGGDRGFDDGRRARRKRRKTKLLCAPRSPSLPWSPRPPGSRSCRSSTTRSRRRQQQHRVTATHSSRQRALLRCQSFSPIRP